MAHTPKALSSAKPQKPASPAPSRKAARNRTSKRRTYIRSAPRQHVPNSRHHWKEYLPAEKALDLVEAATHAHTIGLPLNQAVAIHFERGELPDIYRPQDAIHYWLKAAGQWLRNRGVQMTFIWVIEQAIGTGIHVHILLHCPPQHQKEFFKKGRTSWLLKAGMSQKDKRTLHNQRVGPRGYEVGTASKYDHGSYQRQLKGALRYHLKAISPDQAAPRLTGSDKPFAELFGIEPEYSHPIYGRRASQSQNISKKARDKYHAKRA